jgi:hypothetical protein
MEIIHLPSQSPITPKPPKRPKDKQLIFKEIYDEVQIISKTPRTEKPVKRIQTPDRILLSTPQINRLAYDQMDSGSRSRMIQAVCESPGVLTLFHKNKLFVKGKDANSKFITTSLPIQSTNKTESFHSKTKKVLVKKPKLKFSYLAKDFEDTMSRIKTVNNSEKTSRSRIATCRSNNVKNDLCLALSSIEKQCEISKKLGNQAVEKALGKKNSKMEVWIDKVHWTTSRLQKWADLGNEVVKELFDYEVYVKDSERSDAEDINKSLINKSSHEVRDQAKFIKKILIKKKMKIL